MLIATVGAPREDLLVISADRFSTDVQSSWLSLPVSSSLSVAVFLALPLPASGSLSLRRRAADEEQQLPAAIKKDVRAAVAAPSPTQSRDCCSSAPDTLQACSSVFLSVSLGLFVPVGASLSLHLRVAVCIRIRLASVCLLGVSRAVRVT